MNGDSKKFRLMGRVRDLFNNKVFGIVLLILLVLVGNFLIQQMLVYVLRTTRPLHTPISGSMKPTLNIGDLLIIKGGQNGESIYANISDGNIIIFRSPLNPNGIPIVHRAIEKYQKDGTWYFVTKGDNPKTNPHPDPWEVPEDLLLGKVILVVPFMGYLLRGLDETGIYFGKYYLSLRVILIGLLLAIFLYLELKTSEKTEKNRVTLENS